MKEKHYLTEEGLEELKEERERLQEERQEKLDGDVPEVLHSEDLNPEFSDFRREMYLLEKRLGELEEILSNAEVIEPPEDKNKVDLGARVTVKAHDQEDVFEIVDPLESDPDHGKISNESPVGKALMEQKEGDEVTVSSRVETVYKIKNIEY